MTQEEHSMFALPDSPKMLRTNRMRVKHALEIYSSRGITLKHLSEPKILNKSVSTLKKYCRDFQIKFPDYVPLTMRPEKEKKAKKARKNAKPAV